MTQCWTFDSSISFLKPFLIVIKLFHNCYCFLFKPANNNLLSWSNYKIIVFPIFAARGKVDSTFDTTQSDQQKGEQHTTNTNQFYFTDSIYCVCCLSLHDAVMNCHVGVGLSHWLSQWHDTLLHLPTLLWYTRHTLSRQGKWHLICLKGELVSSA